jgi:N-acetylglucosaminyl-diphospho-decaprenol L-rhamnosyltransferase
MTPTLSFIIVNWNGGELLKRCLESIALYPPSIPWDIVVVDNASTDGSREWLRSLAEKRSPKGIALRLIENDENAGFGKANNQAFALTKSDFLFLLNADAELTPGACDALIKTLTSSEKIGACGPRLLNSDGSLQHSVWRNPPTAREIIVSSLGLWRLIPRRLRGELLLGGHWDHATRRVVPLLFGAAILAKRKMIDEVGGFDERFHMYSEDREWCFRIVRAGWQLVFDPAASVVHHGAQFSLQRWTSLEKIRVQIQSNFQYNRYCLSRGQSIAYLLATCFVSFIQKTWYKLRGRPTEATQIIWELNRAELKRTLTGN